MPPRKLLATVVRDGDTKASLERLRDYLAETLDACRTRHRVNCECECGPATPRARDIADLSSRLHDVLMTIEKLPGAAAPTHEVTPLDQVGARRAARRAAAADSRSS